jgi:hypothetical protein
MGAEGRFGELRLSCCFRESDQEVRVALGLLVGLRDKCRILVGIDYALGNEQTHQ